MTDNPYILDILSQPAAMEVAVQAFDPSALAPLTSALQRGDFDRILLTGMGSSLFAAYPIWLALAGAGLPAMWVDAAEWTHHAAGIITPRTLLWLFSQSGRSAEIVAALDFSRSSRPAAILATVNDLESPLAKAAMTFNGLSGVLPIRAVVEQTVATRTFTNALAVGQLGAQTLLSADIEAARAALLQTAATMKEYLSAWEARLEHIGEALGFPKRLALLGRGPSMAAVYTGALTLGEAAKFLAAPYQAGEFRHGPLELANADLTVLLFAGPAQTRGLNQRLLEDLLEHQVNAFWLGGSRRERQIELPEVPELGLPLSEILPVQLLSIHLARQVGVEPGRFFKTGKITLSE